MISTLADFEEATTFELCLLEKLHQAAPQDSTDVIDRRGDPPVLTTYITERFGSQATEALKAEITPLLFGAAWKLLDLTVEFSLNRVGLRSRDQKWSIAEKQAHASRAEGDRYVLGCSEAVWEAVMLVYARTVEHRHCLVHRTARVDASSGALDGEDRQMQPLQTLTRDHQVAFAQVAALTARAIVDGGIDSRSEAHLMYYLDRLIAHTGTHAFGVGPAHKPVVIQLALTSENGVHCLDMTGVNERASATLPAVAHFDILVDVPGESGRKLFGHAEDCPPGRTTIDLRALPDWLEYR